MLAVINYKAVTYIQRRQIILNVKHILNGVAHSSDNTINDMHHSIGGHLVPMNDPGTVDCNHLNKKEGIKHFMSHLQLTNRSYI